MTLPRRLSFVVDSDTWGGAEVYAGHLLRRARESGWEPSLVATEPVCAGLRGVVPAESFAVVALARHSVRAPQIEAALRAQAPDAVLVNLVDPGSNIAAVEASLTVAPTVATLHLWGDTGTGELRARLRAAYGELAALITPAAAARRQILAELGVDAARVVVVPNGVDLPPTASGPAGRRPPRLGGLGRLTDQKGFDVLLGSVRALVQEGLAFDVVIGGTGREAERLRTQAADLPVTFCGFVSDVPAFLSDLDVFCLPSRHEALPLVLLEAMAAGLPCVATDVGDVRQAVGDAAVVVPREDQEALAAALRPLLLATDGFSDLGRRARDRAVRDFDAGLMARRTFAALHASLDAPR